jgi:hypothetical protein
MCEIVFLLVFTQWYASRYFHWGGQLPFAVMVALIISLCLVVCHSCQVLLEPDAIHERGLAIGSCG